MRSSGLACMVALLLLASCATHSGGYAGTARLEADLTAANQTCSGHRWPSATAYVGCLADAERPVWNQDVPGGLALFEPWSKERAALAVRFDQTVTTARQAALAQFQQDNAKATGSAGVLGGLPPGVTSEIKEAVATCGPESRWTKLVALQQCEIRAARPVLKRMAPQALHRLDRYVPALLEAGARFDSRLAAAKREALVQLDDGMHGPNAELAEGFRRSQEVVTIGPAPTQGQTGIADGLGEIFRGLLGAVAVYTDVRANQDAAALQSLPPLQPAPQPRTEYTSCSHLGAWVSCTTNSW